MYMCHISMCVCAAAQVHCVCVGGCVCVCVCGRTLSGTESHYEHKQPVEAEVKDVFIQKISLSPSRSLSSSLP